MSAPSVAEVQGACPDRPRGGCEDSPRSSRLIVENHRDNQSDLHVWRWTGPLLGPADIGSPTTSARYSLCVYDTFEESTFRLMSLPVEPGSSWRHGKPEIWQYTAARNGAAGVSRVLLKASPAGKSRIRFRAEGERHAVAVGGGTLS